jgi:hypothetical protein
VARMGRRDVHRVLVGTPERKNHFDGPGARGKNTVTDRAETDGSARTGLSWLWTGTGGGILWTR